MKGAGLMACLLALCAGCSRAPVAPAGAVGGGRTEPAEPGRLRAVRFPPDSPMLARIRTDVVESARVPLEEVVVPGRIQAIPTRVSRVALPVPGRIRRVLVELGGFVEAGQVLFSMDSPEVAALVSAYRQAEARAAQATAALAKAEADLARARDLFEHGAVAQKEVLSAEAALAQAQAESAQASAAVQEALGRLGLLGLRPEGFDQEILVRAPASGQVLDISLAPGEFRSDTSAAVITIADLSTVYIVAEVPESLIRLISVGERMAVSLAAYPGELFLARVTRIAGSVNPETRTIAVIAELANPQGRLRPDMFGEIRHEETFRELPVVPAGAVVRRERRDTVWREEELGYFVLTEVTVGRPRQGLVPVLSGLRPGDRVVVDGAMLLERGG